MLTLRAAEQRAVAIRNGGTRLTPTGSKRRPSHLLPGGRDREGHTQNRRVRESLTRRSSNTRIGTTIACTPDVEWVRKPGTVRSE